MKVSKWIKEHKYLQHINWPLLLFLVLFLNVKLVVKLVAIVLICILNRKNLFPIRFWQDKLQLFYLSMIVIVVINVLLQLGSITMPYLIAAGVGIAFWIAAAFASYQCFVYTEKNEPLTVHSTITLFFMLNVLVTFATLFKIIIETGAVNPYTYQGMNQKYFIMTGDYMRGISFDTSTTNSVLNAFGIVYFINRQKALLALLCMAGILLAASNFTNLLLVVTLGYLFVFRSNRDQKSLIIICLFFLVIFFAKISPQNNSYVQNTLKKIFRKDIGSTVNPVTALDSAGKPDSLLSPENRKRKFAMHYLDSIQMAARKTELLSAAKPSSDTKADSIGTSRIVDSGKPDIPQPNIHSEPFQRKRELTPIQKEFIEFTEETKESGLPSSDIEWAKLPGKIIAFKQTIAFLQDHPEKIFTGNGIGNFSSKLAFRTTGLNIAGGYPSKFVYINNEFRDRHLAIFLHYFSKDAELHSLIHSPNSVYNQLLGEYGIAGFLVFIIFYIGFIIRNRKFLTYAIPLLILITGAFFIEYWFEQLSIVIIFELLLFLNIGENRKRSV